MPVGKIPDVPGVSTAMRDKNTISARGAMPRDADGEPVRKCGKARCSRPAVGRFKLCASCRCYAREYQQRHAKGAAQAAAYCAKMWAPKENAK